MSGPTGAGFRSATADVNGVTLHYQACGSADAPLFLFLHGFPEYWVAWAQVMPHFAETHHCVAPDQRGYNLSSKPGSVSDYAVRHLVEDIHQLGLHLSPHAKFILAGHDWGASVAYAYAMRHPDRVEKLVIANGVHPGPFQKALLTDRDQIGASQYMHALRAPDAAAALSRDDFEPLFARFAGFSDAQFLTPEEKDGYRAAWSRDGALECMLNWYRASAIYVPEEDETPDPGKAIAVTPESTWISMPHLLVFGTADRALRPSSYAGIEDYGADITVERVEGAGHWILHEKPDTVASLIAEWL